MTAVTSRVFVVMALVVMTCSLQASERKDIQPGEANWHRYRFHVVGNQVAVRQTITILWDNPQSGIAVAVYDTADPNAPKLVALSAGNDRLVTLDLGLLKGSYQLVVAAVSAPTHYHLNVTYGNDELLFQSVNGPRQWRDVFTERLIDEDFAPFVAKVSQAARY